MPLLQVRDIPEDLYDELSRVAKQDNRSIAQETIVLLRNALDQKNERIKRRQAILEQAKKLNLDPNDTLPDPVELIREDRNR